MLRVIFWAVPRRVVFNNRRFGTLCLFHLHRRVDIHATKEDESSTGRIWAAEFCHVTARSRLARVLKFINPLFL
jgi:hypothetical protein